MKNREVAVDQPHKDISSSDNYNKGKLRICISNPCIIESSQFLHLFNEPTLRPKLGPIHSETSQEESKTPRQKLHGVIMEE